MRRPGYDSRYCGVVCGRRVAFASVHASQPLNRPRASEDGASAVRVGSRRRRVAPACRRWCM
eukprot:577689-Pleurochrysis_carterae.AAC.1